MNLAERGGVSVLAIDYPGVMPRFEGIKQELAQFPKGTIVGIAASKFLHDPQNYERLTRRGSSEFGYYHWQVTSPNYWDEVIKFCAKHGLGVVYLVDWETQEKCAELLKQKDPIVKELNQLDSGRVGVDLSADERVMRRRYLYEELHRIGIEANNIEVVEIGEQTRKAILEGNVQVVVMQDYLAEHASLEGTNGISIGFRSYKVEDYLKDKFKKSEPSIKASVKREILERQLRAVREWRVTGNNNVDGVGTWDLGIRQKGLFEVQIVEGSKDGSFKCVIDDLLGTALGEGIVTPRGIRFSKTYDLSRSLTNATEPYVVKYEGVATRDGYEGTWVTDENKGQFVLFRGNKFLHESF